jgi:hypothetical protein
VLRRLCVSKRSGPALSGPCGLLGWCARAAVNSVNGVAAVRGDRPTVLAGVRPVEGDFWSGSARERAASLSAAAVLSLLVIRRPRCRSFVVSLCKSSWTDALLFLPSATAFFMPVACSGVEYPWAFWSTLVPMVVGAGAVAAVTVVTLFARRGRFAFGADGRHHISGLFAAVRAPTSAVLQIVALWAVLCAVPLRFCIPTATVVDSWTTMLALLTLAAAAAAAATAVLR